MNTMVNLLPAIVNHFLEEESWARDKLLMHADRVVCFDVGTLIYLQVTGRGTVMLPIDQSLLPAVTIKIKYTDLPLILHDRDRMFSYVKITGDAEFANTISQIFQAMRFEPEHEFAKIFGDIAAVHMVSGASSFVSRARIAAQSVAAQTAEYLLEENPMLVSLDAVQDFGKNVSVLRDDVERMIKRIERLEKLTRQI